MKYQLVLSRQELDDLITGLQEADEVGGLQETTKQVLECLIRLSDHSHCS